MPDDPIQDPAPTNVNPPAGDPPKDPSAQDKNTSDAVSMAKKLGEYETKIKAYEAYQQQVDPFLETVNFHLDKETKDKLVAEHNKRLGITPTDDNNTPPAPQTDPKLQSQVTDLRNSEVSDKVNNFYSRHGIDKMPDEDKKTLNTNVGRILMDMLDPMGNKRDLKEVLEDVPLPKLDKFLEDAYYLATKDQQLENARNTAMAEANQNNRGIIGSFPSQSTNPDTISLSPQEKNIAAKAGWDEKKYLEMKKYIATRPEQGIY